MKTILNILPEPVRRILIQEQVNKTMLQEIRIRAEKPLIFVCDGKERIPQKKHIITKDELREMLAYISRYSLYAYEDEMKQGFITVEGGHRVGLAGQVITEYGKIKNLRHLSSINIRVSHEVKGCADSVMPYVVKNEQVLHSLIISPPAAGKTTLLRDMIRQISDGNQYIKGQTVGVVDERSEIGGCFAGVPQKDLGMRTDILDNCPKAEGTIMLIRAMAPKVIAVDEIGTKEDVHAVSYAMHCGCKMLATVHGHSLDEIRNKPQLGPMVREGMFERYIILRNMRKTGEILGIYDKHGHEVFL